ncbi:hypothetical protein CBR_g50134 [Chara braunii]|uniref:Uncharacterized protein n=1 Tax=Chara braunii TaxID=69332 RepID=A0A388M657_CHABU|nr:hypothetical protein CBR_g50134 [Chara braunii]|eukprot:GBG90041.1 hypothetical protein CBR_g50134 [Chara braunii]
MVLVGLCSSVAVGFGGWARVSALARTGSMLHASGILRRKTCRRERKRSAPTRQTAMGMAKVCVRGYIGVFDRHLLVQLK